MTNDWVPIGLESMVFETHTFGDYTIKLVGKHVRTDKENFPGKIFCGLLAEVEKNGVKISQGSVSSDVTGGVGAQVPFGGSDHSG